MRPIGSRRPAKTYRVDPPQVVETITDEVSAWSGVRLAATHALFASASAWCTAATLAIMGRWAVPIMWGSLASILAAHAIGSVAQANLDRIASE